MKTYLCIMYDNFIQNAQCLQICTIRIYLMLVFLRKNIRFNQYKLRSYKSNTK